MVARVALHGKEFRAMTAGLDYRVRLGTTYWEWPREALPMGFNSVSIARRQREDQGPQIWMDVQANLCSVVHGPEWAFAGLHPGESLDGFGRVALGCSNISGERITRQQLQLRRLDYNVTRAAAQTDVDRVCGLAGQAFGRARKGSQRHFTFRSQTTTEVYITPGVSFEVYDKGQQPDRGVQRAMRIPSYRTEVRHRIDKLRRSAYVDGQGLRWRPTGEFLPDDHALANQALLEVEQMLMTAALDQAVPLHQVLLVGGASLGTAFRLAHYAEHADGLSVARNESERQCLRRWRRELEAYIAEATRRVEQDPTLLPSPVTALSGSPLYARDLRNA